MVCAKLVTPGPVCRGCVAGSPETPFGAPKPQLGPLPVIHIVGNSILGPVFKGVKRT